MPCQNCLVQKNKLNLNGFGKKWIFSEIQTFLSELKKRSVIAEHQHQQSYMLPITPVLSQFPFIGVCNLSDLYAIFRFEPMHALSVGILKMLRDCLVSYLSDSMRFSAAMKYCFFQSMPSLEISKTVLELLKELFKQPEEE